MIKISFVSAMCMNFIFRACCRLIDPYFSSIIPVYTGCEQSEDFSPCLFDCRKFYRCANGYKSTYNCPDGTVFDSNLRMCSHSPPTLCKSAVSEIYGTNKTGYNFNESKQIVKENLKEDTTESSKIDTKLIPSTTSNYLSNVCIYTFTDFERSIFCKLDSFKKTNQNCC